MPTIPAGYALVAHHFDVEGNSNDISITYGVEWDEVSPIATCDELNLCTATFLMPPLSEDLHMNRTVLVGAGDPAPVAESPANTYGGDTCAMPPPDDSILVKKITGLSGRKNRGRMYVPGLCGINVFSSGYLTGPYRSDLQDAIDTWFDELTSLTTVNNVVILHTGSETPTQVSNFVVDTRVANQRRRIR